MRVNVYEIRGNAIYVIIIQTFSSQMCQNVNGYHNRKPPERKKIFFLPCTQLKQCRENVFECLICLFELTGLDAYNKFL